MISVCMATYNGGKYIQSQVASILAQLGPGDELIVSDDGSRDSTLEILRGFDDERLKILHFGAGNIIANFENALRAARGDVIFLSDQDDLWQPNKVERSLAELEKRHLLVVSDCSLIDESGKVIAPSYFRIRKPLKGIAGNLLKNSFMGCCMAFKKEVLLTALPFPSPIPMHDSWIGLVAESLGSVSFIHEPLVMYRRHSSAASSTGAKSSSGLKRQIQDRLNLISALTLRRLGRA